MPAIYIVLWNVFLCDRGLLGYFSCWCSRMQTNWNRGQSNTHNWRLLPELTPIIRQKWRCPWSKVSGSRFTQTCRRERDYKMFLQSATFGVWNTKCIVVTWWRISWDLSKPKLQRLWEKRYKQVKTKQNHVSEEQLEIFRCAQKAADIAVLLRCSNTRHR